MLRDKFVKTTVRGLTVAAAVTDAWLIESLDEHDAYRFTNITNHPVRQASITRQGCPPIVIPGPIGAPHGVFVERLIPGEYWISWEPLRPEPDAQFQSERFTVPLSKSPLGVRAA
jgi:hypothetical protein